MPSPREVDFAQAEIDMRKFSDYSMDPTNPRNDGKHKGFEALGYDLSSAESRAASAALVVGRLREALSALGASEPVEQSSTQFGRRFLLTVPLIGPNGTTATLQTRWLVPKGSVTPRLSTNWVEVHV